MTRLEKYAEVKSLRDEGLLLREIGVRMGLATSTVHDLLTDPTGDKARARKEKANGSCPDCGTATRDSGSPVSPDQRCRLCWGRHERAMSRRWILDSFAEWEELFGIPPSACDWNFAQARANGMEWKAERYESTDRPWPPVSTVLNVFGTWNAGMEAAGFEPRASGMYGRDGEDPVIVAESVRLYRTGLTCAEVGVLMGVSGHAIRCRLLTVGEPRRQAGRRPLKAAA